MRRFYVALPEEKARALVDLAWIERRRPQDQAALLIEAGLPAEEASTTGDLVDRYETCHESA